MPTIFDSLSERFYEAYFEPDSKKRKKAIDKWIKTSTPVIQKAVETDLVSYLEQILKTRWTPEGWESGVNKFVRIMDNYKLVMNIQITDTKHMKYTRTVTPASTEDKAKTLRKAEKILADIDDADVAKNYVKKQRSGDYDDDGGENSSSRSPNDQRSDAMNPNNPEYQDATDNRSNQMNPNNPAYHSSRGHGRR